MTEKLAFGLAVFGNAAGDHFVLIEEDGKPTTAYKVRGIVGRAIAFHAGLVPLVAMLRTVGVPIDPESMFYRDELHILPPGIPAELVKLKAEAARVATLPMPPPPPLLPEGTAEEVGFLRSRLHDLAAIESPPARAEPAGDSAAALREDIAALGTGGAA